MTAPDHSPRRRDWAPPPMNGYRPMIINVAVSGAVVQARDNTSVPLSPAEIIADVLACAAEGASVFHLHVRDEQGEPVHRRDLYEAVLSGIRAAAPELVLGVTTSSRVGQALAQRVTGLDVEPALRPDMASLTLGSFNFPRSVSHNAPEDIVALLEHMQRLGVKPELEVFELGMVNTLWALRERGLIADPPVVNILLGSMGSAPAFVSDLGHIVERLPPGSEWAAAGIGMFQRPMTIAAAIMDGNVRTGLEDDPRGDGTKDWSNVQAVRLAVAAAKLAGRTVATPAQARSRFGLRAVGP